MYWLAITETIINNPLLLQQSTTIDTELSQFLIDVCDAEYSELPSLLIAGITTMKQIATLCPSILHPHNLANLYFQATIQPLNW